MALHHSGYITTMNVPMDCTSSSSFSESTVLDLRKPKDDKPHSETVKYTPPPKVHHPYAPLTPPYNTPSSVAAPFSYQTIFPLPVMESDDRTRLSSSSPPSIVSSSYIMANNVINSGRTGKPTRPFKAYPKDPLALSTAPSVILGQDSTEEYREFRQRMLAQMDMVSCRNNSNMKRSISPQMPSSTAEMDDRTAAYWERRRKNNEAAKRSRDARRAKEDEIAIRAAFLEQENIKLKYELASLRNETAKLRCLVYNR